MDPFQNRPEKNAAIPHDLADYSFQVGVPYIFRELNGGEARVCTPIGPASKPSGNGAFLNVKEGTRTLRLHLCREGVQCRSKASSDCIHCVDWFPARDLPLPESSVPSQADRAESSVPRSLDPPVNQTLAPEQANPPSDGLLKNLATDAFSKIVEFFLADGDDAAESPAHRGRSNFDEGDRLKLQELKRSLGSLKNSRTFTRKPAKSPRRSTNALSKSLFPVSCSEDSAVSWSSGDKYKAVNKVIQLDLKADEAKRIPLERYRKFESARLDKAWKVDSLSKAHPGALSAGFLVAVSNDLGVDIFEDGYSTQGRLRSTPVATWARQQVKAFKFGERDSAELQTLAEVYGKILRAHPEQATDILTQRIKSLIDVNTQEGGKKKWEEVSSYELCGTSGVRAAGEVFKSK